MLVYLAINLRLAGSFLNCQIPLFTVTPCRKIVTSGWLILIFRLAPKKIVSL